MKVLGLLVLSLIAQATLCDVDSPVAAVTRNSQQEAYLAKQAYGNFACRVSSVVVKTDSPGYKPSITADSVRLSLTNKTAYEWAHVAQASFSSFDVRNEEKILGTPGGDMGEFILSLHAIAKVSGTVPSREDVQKMFERYLRIMTREKFFYETDERAYTKLAMATGCRNLHISQVGGMKRKREDIINQIVNPDHIGDLFIKFLVTNSTAIGIDVELVQSALAAYHNVLWTTPSELAQKLCYQEFKGPQNIAAFINIKTSSFCVDQGLVPLFSSQFICDNPVFINHPDAAKILRREFATVLTLGSSLAPQDVLSAHNTLAENTYEKFLSTFSSDIPSFTVSLINESRLLKD